LLTLLKSAKKLKETDMVDIKIFGDGIELTKLKKFKEENNIKHVNFYGKVQKDKILKEYINSDALFLSLAKDKFLNYTIPAKLQTYFSIGKPIIASASGEAKKIILSSKSGYCSPPENEFLLHENLIKLINLNKKTIKRLGKNSKKYYKQNFSNDIITKMFKKILN
jgi:glycosyltransferase involved in cell wall biosynthesis